MIYIALQSAAREMIIKEEDCVMSLEGYDYNKDVPDFIDKSNWQFVDMELNRAYWRSIKGARVELFPSYWRDDLPEVVVRPDGKSQNFTGEDAIERAWTVAEMFRKQE